MSTMEQVQGFGWKRGVATVAIASAATLLLLALSASVERTAGWQPPSGARIALYIHLVTVIPAVPLGAIVLWRPKGDAPHQLMGRIWAVLMMVTAISSFWLQSLRGGFSFIHLFSVLTLISIPMAIWHARRGNIRRHMNAMRGVYAGLIAAGLFAAAPGRFLGQLFFG